MYDLTHSLWVNTGWANGLFSVGIKPLPQAMLTNQHWGLVTPEGHFTGTYLSLMWVWNWLILKLGWHLLGASELSRNPCKYLHMELDYGGFFWCFLGLLLLTWVHPAWISNPIPSKVWGEITYPFNGCTVEVWEWIRYFIPHFIMDVITYSCWD